MRAIVVDEHGRPSLADVPEPEGEGVLVEVRACGLCGSDLEKLGRASAGTVLGHEIAGELSDGTRVTAAHRVACGSCARCRAGHESTCDEFRVLRIAPGGFAERLRATHLFPLPDSLGPFDGVWVEPVACILRAAERLPAGRVLVVGCGAVGLLWVQVLLGGGREVEALDPRLERLGLALRLGADEGGGEVDAAVVTAAAGINAALACLAPGGTLLVFSAPEENVPTSLDAVYRKELTVVGSRSATPAFFERALELLPSLDLPPVTTLSLDRFAEGVDLYRRGEALKVVFVP